MTRNRLKAGVFLGLILMVAGGAGRTSLATIGRDPVPETRQAPASADDAAAGLRDALNLAFLELAGPGLPGLIAAVRDLAVALETPGGDVAYAVASARRALVEFAAASNPRDAMDLDVIRFAIDRIEISN
jgi:hypothetical protein